MEKVIFTSSLLNRYSTLEDIKNHFNINNISPLDYLNETLEITTNNSDIFDKRLVIYGVFFEFFKDNSNYQYFYSKTAVEVFIKNKLLQHNITEKFITKKNYMYIKFKYSIEDNL